MIISATLHTLFSADAEGHFGFYYFMRKSGSLTVWIKRRSEGRGRTVRGFFITRTENARLPSQREVA